MSAQRIQCATFPTRTRIVVGTTSPERARSINRICSDLKTHYDNEYQQWLRPLFRPRLQALTTWSNAVGCAQDTHIGPPVPRPYNVYGARSCQQAENTFCAALVRPRIVCAPLTTCDYFNVGRVAQFQSTAPTRYSDQLRHVDRARGRSGNLLLPPRTATACAASTLSAVGTPVAAPRCGHSTTATGKNTVCTANEWESASHSHV